jgi:hypothetical protein
MGHRDTLLCDTTYRNATAARSAPRASVRRSQSGFVQVAFRASSPGQKVRCVELGENPVSREVRFARLSIPLENRRRGYQTSIRSACLLDYVCDGLYIRRWEKTFFWKFGDASEQDDKSACMAWIAVPTSAFDYSVE